MKNALCLFSSWLLFSTLPHYESCCQADTHTCGLESAICRNSREIRESEPSSPASSHAPALADKEGIEDDDFQEYLEPFISFLQENADTPREFVMNALARYKLVIIGEAHHRPLYWDFNASLVTDSRFPKTVGVMYLELPSCDQQLADEFLDSSVCDRAFVIEILRDMEVYGWPNQALLDFFIKVWLVNQNLPKHNRIRIVLADKMGNWKTFKNQYHYDRSISKRDEYLADRILKDLTTRAEDHRNALFITGSYHAAFNLLDRSGLPCKRAGWYLRKALGSENVYGILQHKSVRDNSGKRRRMAYGLVETAIAALGGTPTAFPLNYGPFAKLHFDLERSDNIADGCEYRDGFSALFYLGPLEYEIHAPLIEGFYTDEFAEEISRRELLVSGQILRNATVRNKGAEHYIRRFHYWGKPRNEWSRKELGPMDAWKKRVRQRKD